MFESMRDQVASVGASMRVSHSLRLSFVKLNNERPDQVQRNVT